MKDTAELLLEAEKLELEAKLTRALADVGLQETLRSMTDDELAEQLGKASLAFVSLYRESERRE